MVRKYEYLIDPEIGKLESNKALVPKFSLGANFSRYSEHISPPIRISFHVGKVILPPSDALSKFHLYYSSERDELHYVKPIGLGINIKLHLRNLFKDTELIVNEPYYRYVRVRLDNVYPPGAHLADILIVNLLQRDYSPLHCAAISLQGEGSLLVAPPDTGKTITTLLALKRGFSYLAEDIAVVDQENVYMNPYTSTFLHNEEFEGYNKMNKFIFNFSKKIPLLSSYLRPKVSISNYMKRFNVEKKAPIRNIFILDRGKSSFERMDIDETVRRTMIINRNEFSYYKNPLLFAYSYYNPSLDMDKLMRAETELIRTIVGNAECYLLRTTDSKEYIELVSRALKR